jgi:hypothetical protein
MSLFDHRSIAKGSRGRGTKTEMCRYQATTLRDTDMRSILLMFLGVPLPFILLLAFCTHHF